MDKTGFLALIKNRNFLLLWGEQVLSQFSYNLLNFALLIWVFRISQSSFAESLLILSFILPTALFGVFTGIVADLYDRRKIMLTIHIIWAVLALSFIFIKDNLTLILLFSFILNTIDRFFTPAEQASIPNIVPKENLLLANSLFSFSLNLGFLLGFSLAGPLMFIWGNNAPFYLASTFVVGGLFLIYFLPNLRPTSSRASLSISFILPETLRQIKSGFLFVRGKRLIMLAILVFSAVQIVVNSAIALSPSFVVGLLGFPDPKHASWIVMLPVGLGSVLAILLLRFWQNKLKRYLVERGILIAGWGFLGLWVTVFFKNYIITGTFFILVFIFCLLLGLSAVLVLVPTMTIFSQYTPNDYLGKVWGVASLIQYLAASIPLLAVGILADLFSVRPMLLGVAIACFIIYTLASKILNEIIFIQD